MYDNFNLTPYGCGERGGRFLPFLAGIALTAPFWLGRRCCPPYYPYYPYPYPVTFNTYTGIVGSPYSFYYGRPFIY